MKRKVTLYVFLLWMCCLQGMAQKTGMQSFSMKLGENYIYELSYKWGFMVNAGEASFVYKADRSIEGATSAYRLLYKSSKLLDTFFKMRDTLITSYNEKNELVYSQKYSEEGTYYLVDLMKFKKDGNKTIIQSLQYTLTKTKHDTTLVATGDVADLLGILFYLRGINRSLLKSGDVFPLTVVVGKDLVKIQFVYQHQAIVEHKNVKYNTHYFKIDIHDDAFESSKAAAEVWIGDDDNFLPIKVRTKMKIGYIEVYYKSSSSLAHPLSSSIPMK